MIHLYIYIFFCLNSDLCELNLISVNYLCDIITLDNFNNISLPVCVVSRQVLVKSF